MIYIDTREKKSFAKTDAWKDVEVQYITMETADYTNSNGAVKIERKSVADLCNSLGKGKKRFYREIGRGFSHLIVEGCELDITIHLKRVASKMTPQYIMHCLKEIHEKYEVQIILANDRENAAEIALHILNNYNISPNCL
jgi:ERCC4-type nuclease